ncbi:hypothetical protein IX51_02385 [uncultured archaeon]|nr:hypothetical protein IX51_02385 [uncultured archaeon]
MALRDTYRNMVVEKVQKRAGFSLDQGGVPARQWKRISELSEILHEAVVLEQMIRVEEKRSRSVSSRISSRIRPAKAEELKQSLSSLEKVKSGIWNKCDSIAYDIVREKEMSGADSVHAVPPDSAGIMRCRACGGGVSILAYDNYKCTKCGLGYSARDYLEILIKDVEGI